MGENVKQYVSVFIYLCCFSSVFTDAPVVTLVGAPTQDLEENVHSVRLRCVADANPPADILWRRNEDTAFYSSRDEIIFKPVHRNYSGTYTCQAKNTVGTSDMLSVKLDVKCEYLYLLSGFFFFGSGANS